MALGRNFNIFWENLKVWNAAKIHQEIEKLKIAKWQARDRKFPHNRSIRAKLTQLSLSVPLDIHVEAAITMIWRGMDWFEWAQWKSKYPSSWTLATTQRTEWRRFQATQQSTDPQGQGKQQMGLSICSCSNGGVANAILRWFVWRWCFLFINWMKITSKWPNDPSDHQSAPKHMMIANHSCLFYVIPRVPGGEAVEKTGPIVLCRWIKLVLIVSIYLGPSAIIGWLQCAYCKI